MLDKIKSSDFSPYLNQTFHIHAEASKPLEAELVDVTEFKPRSDQDTESSKRNPFSIIFSCAQDQPLEQKIYKVEHDEMGTLELFLVPIGPDKNGLFQYEALFN